MQMHHTHDNNSMHTDSQSDSKQLASPSLARSRPYHIILRKATLEQPSFQKNF